MTRLNHKENEGYFSMRHRVRISPGSYNANIQEIKEAKEGRDARDF